MKSRRPVYRLNRGRVAASGAAGFPPGGTLQVSLLSPSSGAVIPINSPVTISGWVSSDADAVQVYLDYPATPIGAATIVGGTWSITYTPDITSAGNHNLAAYATRGVSTANATQAVRVTLVQADGTWDYWNDFRATLATATVGAAVPNLAPQEGTGTLVPTNAPLVTVGAGSRKAADLVAGTLHHLTATSGLVTTAANGTAVTGSKIIALIRANVTSASGTIFGWGTAGSNNGYLKVTTNSGKVLNSISRKAGSDAAQTAAPGALLDFDIPSVQTRTVEMQLDPATGQLDIFVDGVADGSNPETLVVTATSLASDLFRIGAWPLNSNAQNTSMQVQLMAVKRVATLDGAAGALARHNWIIASEIVAPAGAGLQFLGDSTMLGQVGTGGCRKAIMDAIAAALYTVSAVGPRAYGGFTQNQCNAQGGNNFSAVRTQQITPYVGLGKGFESIQRTFWIGFTNDVDEAAITAATCVARWRTTADLLQSSAVTAKSNHRIYASTALPYNPASNAAAAANVAAINGGLLQAEVASFNAANPSNQIILVDSYAALGSGWNSTDMADDRHPSQTGYNKIAAAMFAACSADLATLVP